MKSVKTLLLFSILLLGCASTPKISDVCIGMSKSEVIEKIGRGKVYNKMSDAQGREVEEWHYDGLKSDESSFIDPYLFIFIDGKLTDYEKGVY